MRIAQRLMVSRADTDGRQATTSYRHTATSSASTWVVAFGWLVAATETLTGSLASSNGSVLLTNTTSTANLLRMHWSRL